MKRIFYILSLFAMSAASAADLHGNVSLNITSDTAAAAKNIAIVEARRQIVSDVLAQYSDRALLMDALGATGDEVLNSLIASTSIAGEQVSTTTYSANISMEIDAGAARSWLTENGIQNWLPNADGENRLVVLAEMSSPLVQWVELNDISRREKIDINVKNINGNQLMIDLPVTSRGAFTIALRENGWRYSNMDGALRVWK
jgi:hypothetical protein